MGFTKGFLRVTMFVLAIGGLAYIVAPTLLLDGAGISANPGGLTEMRAVYGGFQLGLAAFLYWALADEERIHSALVMIGLLLGAIVSARVIGLAIDRDPSIFVVASLVVELVALDCVWFAFRRLHPTAVEERATA